MQEVFKRVLEKKIESKKTWDEIAREAHIGLASWMCGVLCAHPNDGELKKIALALGTTFEYLKYGDKK